MGHALAIAAGGAIGALLRYWVGAGAQLMFGRQFPVGTLSVNVLGSVAIGVLSVVLVARGSDDAMRALVLVGLLGAFTTFSTFSLETIDLIQSGRLGAAAGSVTLNVVLCVGGAWLGIQLGQRIL